MEEEVRPEIEQVLLAYVVALSLLAAALGAVLLVAPLPPFAASALDWLGTIAIMIYFGCSSMSALWAYLTERYAVGDGYVSIRRGVVSRTSSVIPAQTVTEARAVMPLLLRKFGIGFITIRTNDGSEHVMRNVKHPERVAESIRPRIEPVFRPSVG
ncbi:MAG: PH domain-containing protein [Nitrososphaerota archaeon]|nr:PH domain-containing protein [Nitrososphaerota archaeon]